MKKPRLTRQAWERVLASLHWGEEALADDPSPEYFAWMQANSHSHDYSEIVVCLAGSHLYGVDGKALQLAPGSAILIPNKLPHDQCYSPNHGECIDFWLHILPHGRVTLNFLFNEPETGQAHGRVVPPSAFLIDDFKKAASLLGRQEGHPAGMRKARHFLLYLLHELFEMLIDLDPGKQSFDECSVVEDIKRYASENLTDRLALADLAKAAGYSPFHFHRMFLEIEGITPRSFVEGRRLKKACDLLKSGLSITSAALDSGFASSSQFSRVFKKQFQLSPTEWIRSIRSNRLQ